MAAINAEGNCALGWQGCWENIIVQAMWLGGAHPTTSRVRVTGVHLLLHRLPCTVFQGAVHHEVRWVSAVEVTPFGVAVDRLPVAWVVVGMLLVGEAVVVAFFGQARVLPEID